MTKKMTLLGVAAAVLGGTLAVPLSAQAVTAGDLTADGGALSGSTQADGSFVLAVPAPAGVTVKFKLDGEYLGQDGTAPYSWPIQTTAGTHKADVRWESGGQRQEFVASFTVGSASPTTSGNTVSVATAAQLTAALKAAKAGQTIALADGTYTGKFVAAASGTASNRISLTGSRNAVLSTGSVSSGYALNVTGDYWNVSGLSVTKASKGIVLDGSSHSVIDGVDVGRTGAEAIHLRKSSADVVVRNSVIHDTGLDQPSYGEGVYIGSAKSNWSSIMGSSDTPDRSDSAQVLGNTFRDIAAEGIDIKEGTAGGVVSGNVFTNAGYSGENYADSWIDLKGNGYRITGNSGSGTLLDAFQVHVAVDGWGQSNSFSGNTVAGGVPGYEVSVQSGATGTTVACAPTKAAKGLTNISCG